MSLRSRPLLPSVGEDRKDEETVNRALSEELASPRQHPPEPQVFEERIEVDEPMAEPADDVDAESGDSSDDSDLSVVKVVSDDPWAAAAPEAGMFGFPCSCFPSNPACSMIGILS
jgi:hypothetical protein